MAPERLILSSSYPSVYRLYLYVRTPSDLHHLCLTSSSFVIPLDPLPHKCIIVLNTVAVRFIYSLTDLDDQRLSLGPVKASWLRYGCYEDLDADPAYLNRRQFLLVGLRSEIGFLRSVLSVSCNRCCTLTLNPLSIFDSPNRLLYGLTPHFMFTPSTVTIRLFICLVTVGFVLTNEFSRTGVHGTSLFFQDTLVEFPSPLSNQANIHSSSSSSLSHKYATVSPVFSLNNIFSGTVEIHLVSRSIIVSIEVDLGYLMDCMAKSSFSMSIAKAWIFTEQSGISNTLGSTMQDTALAL
ncbi:unnamed protein product [Brassica rapa subsp. trilocularis]